MEQEKDNGQQLDVGELQRQLKILKSAQAGSDRRVAELLKEKEELNAAWQSRFDTMKQEKRQMAEQLEQKTGAEAKEREAFQRQKDAYELIIAKGREPKVDMELLGFTGLSDEERIDKLAEHDNNLIMAERDVFAKKNGRTPHQTPNTLLEATDYEDLQGMTDKQIQRMGTAVDYITEKELKKKKHTWRDRINNAFGGGK